MARPKHTHPKPQEPVLRGKKIDTSGLTLDELTDLVDQVAEEIKALDPCMTCKEPCNFWCAKKRSWYDAFRKVFGI